MTEFPQARVLVGIDLQPVSDIVDGMSRHGDRYLRRLFTTAEQQDTGWPDEPLDAVAERLAGRFAAKEAFLKAMRLGGELVPDFVDIEVYNEPGGAPSLRLYRKAAAIAARSGVTGLSLSIAHGGGLAIAIVNATLRPPNT